MLCPNAIRGVRIVLLTIAQCVCSGCYVEVDKHYQVSPTLDNPLEVVLGGKVTDQLVAMWEYGDHDSTATLESLRQITNEVPIVADNPWLINETPQQLWEQAIAEGQSRSFQTAIRAVRSARRPINDDQTSRAKNESEGWRVDLAVAQI